MKIVELYENVGLDTPQIAQQILDFAEEHTYNVGGGVNDDDVLRIAQQALAEIENLITQKIENTRQ